MCRAARYHPGMMPVNSRHPWTTLAALGALLGALAACSPTHNWRQTRLQGVPLQAMMPCKPEHAQREVPLWGVAKPPVTLTMLSCTVGDHTFALAALPLGAPPTAGQDSTAMQAVQAWKQAGWTSLRQVPQGSDAAPLGWNGQAWQVAGARWAQLWRGPGSNHLGKVVQAQWLLAHNGQWLVQAALYGPPAPEEVSATYFEGLKFD